jgi:hypothetical protein
MICKILWEAKKMRKNYKYVFCVFNYISILLLILMLSFQSTNILIVKAEGPYSSFDWRDANLDSQGHGIPGNGNGHDWTTSIKKQGAEDCYLFGAIGVLESVINIKEQNPNLDLDLSEQYILSCCPYVSTTHGDPAVVFSWMVETNEYGEQNGIILEDRLPYAHSDDIPCPTVSYDEKIRINGNKWCNSVSDETYKYDYKNFIIENGPVAVPLYMPGDFFSYKGGYVYTPTSEPCKPSIHEIIIVGWNDDPGYWICKNSWGTHWGEDKFGNPWDENGDGILDNEGGWCKIVYDAEYFDANSDSFEPMIPKSRALGVDYTPTDENSPLIIEARDDCAFYMLPSTAEETEIHFYGVVYGGISPYVFMWDFNDDGQYDDYGSEVSHTFDNFIIGENKVKLTVIDDNGEGITKDDYDYILIDTPPEPTITGPKFGLFFGKEYEYEIKSHDSDNGSEVWYNIYWDDLSYTPSQSGWIGKDENTGYSESDTAIFKHMFQKRNKNLYRIKVKAKDQYNVEGYCEYAVLLPKSSFVNRQQVKELLKPLDRNRSIELINVTILKEGEEEIKSYFGFQDETPLTAEEILERIDNLTELPTLMTDAPGDTGSSLTGTYASQQPTEPEQYGNQSGSGGPCMLPPHFYFANGDTQIDLGNISGPSYVQLAAEATCANGSSGDCAEVSYEILANPGVQITIDPPEGIMRCCDDIFYHNISFITSDFEPGHNSIGLGYSAELNEGYWPGNITGIAIMDSEPEDCPLVITFNNSEESDPGVSKIPKKYASVSCSETFIDFTPMTLGESPLQEKVFDLWYNDYRFVNFTITVDYTGQGKNVFNESYGWVTVREPTGALWGLKNPTGPPAGLSEINRNKLMINNTILEPGLYTADLKITATYNRSRNASVLENITDLIFIPFENITKTISIPLRLIVWADPTIGPSLRYDILGSDSLTIYDAGDTYGDSMFSVVVDLWDEGIQNNLTEYTVTLDNTTATMSEDQILVQPDVLRGFNDDHNYLRVRVNTTDCFHDENIGIIINTSNGSTYGFDIVFECLERPGGSRLRYGPRFLDLGNLTAGDIGCSNLVVWNDGSAHGYISYALAPWNDNVKIFPPGGQVVGGGSPGGETLLETFGRNVHSVTVDTTGLENGYYEIPITVVAECHLWPMGLGIAEGLVIRFNIVNETDESAKIHYTPSSCGFEDAFEYKMNGDLETNIFEIWKNDDNVLPYVLLESSQMFNIYPMRPNTLFGSTLGNETEKIIIIPETKILPERERRPTPLIIYDQYAMITALGASSGIIHTDPPMPFKTIKRQVFNPASGQWEQRIGNVTLGTNLTFRYNISVDALTIDAYLARYYRDYFDLEQEGFISSSMFFMPLTIQETFSDNLEYIENSARIRLGAWNFSEQFMHFYANVFNCTHVWGNKSLQLEPMAGNGRLLWEFDDGPVLKPVVNGEDVDWSLVGVTVSDDPNDYMPDNQDYYFNFDTMEITFNVTVTDYGDIECGDIMVGSFAGQQINIDNDSWYGNVPYPSKYLNLSSYIFDFGTMNEGQVNSTTFEIWNMGNGTLNYSLDTVNCSWLDVDPLCGNSTGEHDTIIVQVNTSGLSNGYYYHEIGVDSDGGSDVFCVGLLVSTGSNLSEVMDVNQSQDGYGFMIYGSRWGSQSFKPGIANLSSLDLLISRTGTPYDYVTISIRSWLNGSDLVNISVPMTSIPTSPEWVTFDLPDMNVTIDDTYYILVRTTGGTGAQCYVWGFGYQTPYTDGMFRFSANAGVSWTDYQTYDFCFKTYGYQ